MFTCSIRLWLNQAFIALNTCSSESINNSELLNIAETHVKSNSRKSSESATVGNQRSMTHKDILKNSSLLKS